MRNGIIRILNPSTNKMRVPGPPPLYVCHIFIYTASSVIRGKEGPLGPFVKKEKK
jgi:hypothetical protein